MISNRGIQHEKFRESVQIRGEIGFDSQIGEPLQIRGGLDNQKLFMRIYIKIDGSPQIIIGATDVQ